MSTLILAGEAPDLKSLPKEVQDISNELQKLGQVRIQLEVNSFEDLLTIRDKFDLVWIATHSGASGFQFGNLTVRAAQISQLLSFVGAKFLVLNSCFSAEHVMAIQLGSNVEVVATIDPVGVDDNLAWVTGVFLARALVEERGNLSRACRIASGNGAISYRYFPAPGTATRATNFDGSSGESNESTLFRIRRVLEGDPLSGQIGLVALILSLQTNFDKFALSTEDRLQRLEKMERPISLKISFLLTALYVSFFLLTLLVIWRMQ